MRARQLKQIFLRVARALGAFRLARYLTRRKLRILCYHGFSVGDEFKHLPSMFMRGKTFDDRMATLNRLGFPVVSLDEGVSMLETGRVSNAETVITLDDGWASNLSIAYPILRARNFPATIYVTTEHLANSTEVFNIVLHYLFLTSSQSSVALSGVHPKVDGVYAIRPDPARAVISIIETATENMTLEERQASLSNIATSLGLNLKDILTGDRFRLLTSAEIEHLSKGGVAIELHTHTHHLPTESFEAMRADIILNRQAVETITGKQAAHFCYPSGRYNSSHPEWLSNVGIKSATTCDAGLNDSATSKYLLRRNLDQDDVSQIEFEAYMSGFHHFLQRVFK